MLLDTREVPAHNLTGVSLVISDNTKRPESKITGLRQNITHSVEALYADQSSGGFGDNQLIAGIQNN